MMIGVPLAALLAIYLIIQFVLDQPRPTRTMARNRPRLTNSRRRHRGGSLFVTTALAPAAPSRWSTLTRMRPGPTATAVYETASFLIPQAGTFRWSAESGCTVVSRPGPGNLTLPAVVDGVGTSDAFKPPAMITVRVKDFHGNARCDLELRDVATGTVVDIGELDKQKDSVRYNRKVGRWSICQRCLRRTGLTGLVGSS